MAALDALKQALVQKLDQAKGDTAPKTEAVTKAKYAFGIAENKKSKIEEANAVVKATDDARQKTINALDVIKNQIDTQKKIIEPAFKISLKMREKNKDFGEKLATHETAIGAITPLKDKLATPLKEALVAVENAQKLWEEIGSGFEKIDANMTEIAKQINDKKDIVKDAFAIDLSTELIEATTDFGAAKKVFETTTTDLQTNQEEIKTIQERLKLF